MELKYIKFFRISKIKNFNADSPKDNQRKI